MRRIAGKRDLLEHGARLPCFNSQRHLAHAIGDKHVFWRIELIKVIAAKRRAGDVRALARAQNRVQALLDIGRTLHKIIGLAMRGDLPVGGAGSGRDSHAASVGAGAWQRF